MKLLLAIALLVMVLVLVHVQWENLCVSGADSVHCREEERSALLHINASLSSAIHSLYGKECNQWEFGWERVTCDSTTGHITQLDLSIEYDPGYSWPEPNCSGISLNASMFLPLRELRSLSLSGLGIINCTDGAGLETWSNLTKLKTLDLSYNSLDGSIIYDLASVSSLRTLDLSCNSDHININNHLPFKGIESWSNLTKLQMLDLSSNYYLPKNIISSLAKLSSLRALYLDNSNVGDNVPVKELSALNLEVVSLSGCFFNVSFPYLGHWSSLKALSLDNNQITGTLTSKGLCQLKNLEELALSINSLTGNLPPCMGNLSSLKLVDLSDNHLKINFPSPIFERLVSLRYLSLSHNQLEGTLSISSFLNHSNLEVLRLSNLESSSFQVKVTNLSFQLQDLELADCILDVEPTFLYSQHKLQVLDLSNTHSKGDILAMWWLLENNTNLIKLNLNKNFFTGPLQLPFLTHERLSLLDISDNHLGGELPANITTKFPNLLSLVLSRNYFQGPLPLMPKSNLIILDLSSNNLTDDIQNSFSRIQPLVPSIMDLSNNKFYGSITNNLNFTQSSILLLNDNNISGEIPFSICNTSIRVLDISNNELNGVLPYCIGRAYIGALKLSGNHLEGSLPLEMCVDQYRWFIDVSDNKFFGRIPPCSNYSILQFISVSQNSLTGNFPITWLNLSYIRAIDIGENNLSGELPIGMESNLSMLIARENMFGGPIPEQICQFRHLHILDLSHNNLYGEIPSCITDMGDDSRSLGDYVAFPFLFKVGELSFSDGNFLLHMIYDVNVFRDLFTNIGFELISKERSDYYLEEILFIQCIIDLSSNKLAGHIPEDIGRMNWLITLNLSNNHLSGAIPNSISNLQQLESLDLSHNYLKGKIPRELTKLTSLESFSVAYNNLSGPTLGVEAQFISFGKSSYEGNPNLCGPPLSKSCVSTLGTTQPSPNEMSDDRRYEGTDFLILFGSFSLFFVVHFWGFIAILYFKRNWRYALFTLVDWYGDIIYVKVVLWTRKIEIARTPRVN